MYGSGQIYLVGAILCHLSIFLDLFILASIMKGCRGRSAVVTSSHFSPLWGFRIKILVLMWFVSLSRCYDLKF